MKKIIVILGPTASGKSDLAVKLAKKFNGEIISADSRQVYKGMDIGTGKITKKEMKGVRHHLLDVVSPKKTFTVVDYQKLAKKALEKIFKKNKIPIICGGTGFYIDALIYDYNLPKVPPNLKLRKDLEKLELQDLLVILKKLDPEKYKNIDQKNKRRIIRAIEIVKVLGKVPKLNLRRLNLRREVQPPYIEILKIGIKISKEKLKENIEKRLLKRFRQGMVKEVENLHKKGISWQRLDNLGLEYRYVSRYLREFISKGEMIKTLKQEIYKYAKRQMTWFKKDKEIHWIEKFF